MEVGAGADVASLGAEALCEERGEGVDEVKGVGGGVVVGVRRGDTVFFRFRMGVEEIRLGEEVLALIGVLFPVCSFDSQGTMVIVAFSR